MANPQDPDERGKQRRIQSVDRAAQLLLAVASGKTDGRPTTLAAEVGLAVPTAHHLLGTLVAVGLLARDRNSRYTLGPQIAVVADAYQRDLNVPGYLLGPLQQIADSTGETSYLVAWRRGEIKVIGMAEGHLPVRVSVPSGGPYVDAHARAGGKVLLAYAPAELRERYLFSNPLRPLTPGTIVNRRDFEAELEAIRARGWAFEEDEFHSGVSCVCVPVLHDGVLVAAFSISAPTQRFGERRDELVRALQATIRGVERGFQDEPGDAADDVEAAG